MAVYITRGMTVAVPDGGLTISVGDDGRVTGNLTLHVRYDVCPTWTALSLQHASAALEARSIREAAWSGTDENAKAAALEREFQFSMQAIMAAAISLDAFYAIIKPHVAVPANVIEQWRKGRTPRYSQVAEVVRRGFALKPKGAKGLRSNLKEIFRYRDLAVHPSGKIEAPILHPELNLGMEWRFAYFRAANAKAIVDAASWILWDLSHGGKPADAKIQSYMASLKQRLIELFPSGHPSAVTVSKG